MNATFYVEERCWGFL